jgi:diacylglycerol kinase family enzyme
VPWSEPATSDVLARDLARFAALGVDLLIVDGGDGTVRDVLSVLPAAFGDAPPVLAIVPSGKTNILALDLGAGPDWTLQAVLDRMGTATLKTRPPLEVSWAAGVRAPIQGFVLGAGAFVRATQMAQSVHRMGAFHKVAVGLTLAGAAAGVLFGGRRGEWRAGVDLALALDDGAPVSNPRFLAMATTLKRLPLGLAPFGPPREGLKVLDVDAPPLRLHAALPALLAGRDAPWLQAGGYRRADAESLRLQLEPSVVIDGDVFPGGDLTVRRGAPLRFLAP